MSPVQTVRRSVLLAIVLGLLCAIPAWADRVQIDMREGRTVTGPNGAPIVHNDDLLSLGMAVTAWDGAYNWVILHDVTSDPYDSLANCSPAQALLQQQGIDIRKLTPQTLGTLMPVQQAAVAAAYKDYPNNCNWPSVHTISQGATPEALVQDPLNATDPLATDQYVMTSGNETTLDGTTGVGNLPNGKYMISTWAASRSNSSASYEVGGGYFWVICGTNLPAANPTGCDASKPAPVDAAPPHTAFSGHMSGATTATIKVDTRADPTFPTGAAGRAALQGMVVLVANDPAYADTMFLIDSVDADGTIHLRQPVLTEAYGYSTNASGLAAGDSIQIRSAPANYAGRTNVQVYQQLNPLPTATYRVDVFNDTSKTNGEYDRQTEIGLNGFKDVITDITGNAVTINYYADRICSEYQPVYTLRHPALPWDPSIEPATGLPRNPVVVMTDANGQSVYQLYKGGSGLAADALYTTIAVREDKTNRFVADQYGNPIPILSGTGLTRVPTTLSTADVAQAWLDSATKPLLISGSGGVCLSHDVPELTEAGTAVPEVQTRGHVIIRDLAPGRYSSLVSPTDTVDGFNLSTPHRPHWSQTTTLEGAHDWDQWIIAGDSGFDHEFVNGTEKVTPVTSGWVEQSGALPTQDHLFTASAAVGATPFPGADAICPTGADASKCATIDVAGLTGAHVLNVVGNLITIDRSFGTTSPSSGTWTLHWPTTYPYNGVVDDPAAIGDTTFITFGNVPAGSLGATMHVGGYDYTITAVTGDVVTIVPVPVPTGPNPNLGLQTALLAGQAFTIDHFPAVTGGQVDATLNLGEIHGTVSESFSYTTDPVNANYLGFGDGAQKSIRPESMLEVSLVDLNNGDTMVYQGSFFAADAGNHLKSGEYDIPNVPAGDYEISFWDFNQNELLYSRNVTVSPGETGPSKRVELDNTPLVGWWTEVSGTVFDDRNGNGKQDPGEPGIPNFFLSIRSRENTLFEQGANTATTDQNGHYTLRASYPVGQWVVLEAYQDGFKTTGITEKAPNEPKAVTMTGGAVDVNVLPFFSQGLTVDWGKQAYRPDENGGIVSTVSYGTTRNETDPAATVLEDWQAGIPGIWTHLYKPVLDARGKPVIDNAVNPVDAGANGDGSALIYDVAGKIVNQGDVKSTVVLADGNQYNVDSLGNIMDAGPSYQTEKWQRPVGCGAKTNPSPLAGLSVGSAFTANGDLVSYPWMADFATYLGIPAASSTTSDLGCVEGPAAATKIGIVDPTAPNAANDSPWGATVNGNYALGDVWSAAPSATDTTTPPSTAGALPQGSWLVHIDIPKDKHGQNVFQVTKEEDINIASGDHFVPANKPAGYLKYECAGPRHIVDIIGQTPTPGSAAGSDGTLAGYAVDKNGVAVGHGAVNLGGIDNPGFLAAGGTPYQDIAKPLCDSRIINIVNGRSAAPGFELFTPVPLPGVHFGVMMDDLNVNVDPTHTFYGDQSTIPALPVSWYDWSGRLVRQTVTDANGFYEVMLPSTDRILNPSPAGVSAQVYTIVADDPSSVDTRTAPTASNPQPTHPNPDFNKQYRTITGAFQLLPGVSYVTDLALWGANTAINQPGSQTIKPAQCLLDRATPQVFSSSSVYWNQGSGVGPPITLRGTGFGATQGSGGVSLANEEQTPLTYNGSVNQYGIPATVTSTAGGSFDGTIGTYPTRGSFTSVGISNAPASTSGTALFRSGNVTRITLPASGYTSGTTLGTLAPSGLGATKTITLSGALTGKSGRLIGGLATVSGTVSGTPTTFSGNVIANTASTITFTSATPPGTTFSGGWTVTVTAFNATNGVMLFYASNASAVSNVVVGMSLSGPVTGKVTAGNSTVGSLTLNSASLTQTAAFTEQAGGYDSASGNVWLTPTTGGLGGMRFADAANTIHGTVAGTTGTTTLGGGTSAAIQLTSASGSDTGPGTGASGFSYQLGGYNGATQTIYPSSTTGVTPGMSLTSSAVNGVVSSVLSGPARIVLSSPSTTTSADPGFSFQAMNFDGQTLRGLALTPTPPDNALLGAQLTLSLNGAVQFTDTVSLNSATTITLSSPHATPGPGSLTLSIPNVLVSTLATANVPPVGSWLISPPGGAPPFMGHVTGVTTNLTIPTSRRWIVVDAGTALGSYPVLPASFAVYDPQSPSLPVTIPAGRTFTSQAFTVASPDGGYAGTVLSNSTAALVPTAPSPSVATNRPPYSGQAIHISGPVTSVTVSGTPFAGQTVSGLVLRSSVDNSVIGTIDTSTPSGTNTVLTFTPTLTTAPAAGARVYVDNGVVAVTGASAASPVPSGLVGATFNDTTRHLTARVAATDATTITLDLASFQPITPVTGPVTRPVALDAFTVPRSAAMAAVTVDSWSDSKITFHINAGQTPGPYQVYVTGGNGQQSINAITFHVLGGAYNPTVYEVGPNTPFDPGALSLTGNIADTPTVLDPANLFSDVAVPITFAGPPATLPSTADLSAMIGRPFRLTSGPAAGYRGVLKAYYGTLPGTASRYNATSRRVTVAPPLAVGTDITGRTFAGGGISGVVAGFTTDTAGIVAIRLAPGATGSSTTTAFSFTLHEGVTIDGRTLIAFNPDVAAALDPVNGDLFAVRMARGIQDAVNAAANIPSVTPELAPGDPTLALTNKPALIVVYPGQAGVVYDPSGQSASSFNPRGIYYENVIVPTDIKVQGVGPGGTYPDGTSEPGTVVDGSQFTVKDAGAYALDWYDLALYAQSMNGNTSALADGSTFYILPGQTNLTPMKASEVLGSGLGWSRRRTSSAVSVTDAYLNNSGAVAVVQVAGGGAGTTVNGSTVSPDPYTLQPGATLTVVYPAPTVASPAPRFLVHQFGSSFKAGIDGISIEGGDMLEFPTSLNGNGGGPFPRRVLTVGQPVTQGGGVFADKYASFLQVRNDVISGNSGSYGGGVRIGTPNELNPAHVFGTGATATFADDLSGQNNDVVIANNQVHSNGGGRLAGAIGLFNGADRYEVVRNEVCGNYSAEYGAGVSVFGHSPNGVIHHNRIYFNQSLDEGGGIIIAGQLSTPRLLANQPINGTATTPSWEQGTGSQLIDGNVVQGNLAGDDGGGIRFLMVGTDPQVVSNNMIVNNISAHEGGGIAIDDAPVTTIVSNTIAKNITTATAMTSDGKAAPAGISEGINSTQLTGWASANGTSLLPWTPATLLNNLMWDNRAGSYENGNVLGIGVSGDATTISHWDVGTVDPIAALNGGFSASVASSGNILQNRSGLVGISLDNSGMTAGNLFQSTYDLSVLTSPQRANAHFVAGTIVAVDFPPTRMGDYHQPVGGLEQGKGTDLTSYGSSTPSVLADIDGDRRPTTTSTVASWDVGADQNPDPTGATTHVAVAAGRLYVRARVLAASKPSPRSSLPGGRPVFRDLATCSGCTATLQVRVGRTIRTARLKASGSQFVGSLRLKPGKYRYRVVIRDARHGRTHLSVWRTITIPTTRKGA